MPSYDPQRSRHRPSPADADEPAPVDALLEPLPAELPSEVPEAPEAPAAEPSLPDGVDLELTEGGGAVLHTAGADIEITASGDDVVVATDDALVEVRAGTDEVVIEAGGEQIHVDTTPRGDASELAAEWLDEAGAAPGGRSKLVLAVVAALVTLLAILLWARRRDR